MRKPNQRTIIVERTTESIKKDYFKVSNTNLREAMYNLKSNAFKLWCYLCDNSDQWQFDLYSCDFIRVAKVDSSTYQRAFDQLVEAGYLIPSTKRDNVYKFVEQSAEAKQIPSWNDVIKVVDKDEFDAIT